jgi:hypothetical protein
MTKRNKINLIVSALIICVLLLTNACSNIFNSSRNMRSNNMEIISNDNSTNKINTSIMNNDESEYLKYSSDNFNRYRILKKLDINTIGNFHDNLAVCQDINGLFGYVDINGDWIIQPIYCCANDFNNGLALVKTNEGALYIDTKGNVILNSDNFDGYGFQCPYDEDGTTVISGMSEKDGVRIHYSSVIDNKGDILIDGRKLNLSDISSSVNGLRIAKSTEKLGGTCDTGIIDNDGSWIIEPIFDKIDFYDNNTLIVSRVLSDKSGMESGFMTAQGNWIKEPEDSYIHDFGYDMIVYYSMDEPQYMQLYDTDGNILLNGESFHSIEIIEDKLVRCKKNDSSPYELYWSDGSLAFDGLNVERGYYLDEKIICACVLINERELWGLIDVNKQNQWLINPKYEVVSYLNEHVREGLVTKEYADNITFYLEQFDITGQVICKSNELVLPLDIYKSFINYMEYNGGINLDNKIGFS